MKTSVNRNNIENMTVNYRIEIVRDFNNVYYVNMTADNGEYVKGLPEYVGYMDLKKAVKCLTGCELPTLKSLTFEGNGRKKYAHIERTGHQTQKALQITSEITEQREQNDAGISSAESRRDKANGQITDAEKAFNEALAINVGDRVQRIGTGATGTIDDVNTCDGKLTYIVKYDETQRRKADGFEFLTEEVFPQEIEPDQADTLTDEEKRDTLYRLWDAAWEKARKDPEGTRVIVETNEADPSAPKNEFGRYYMIDFWSEEDTGEGVGRWVVIRSDIAESPYQVHRPNWHTAEGYDDRATQPHCRVSNRNNLVRWALRMIDAARVTDIYADCY